MSNPTIVVFSGSARRDSVNKKVAAVATKALERNQATVIHLDLAEFEAPIYNGDDEENSGIPESMIRLEEIIANADGLLIATPEYNGFVPPLLVNIFSWVSRGEKKALAGKFAALLAASPGKLGGIRVIPRLRDELAELGVSVIPGFVTIPGAYQAFDEDGTLKDDSQADAISAHAAKLVAALS